MRWLQAVAALLVYLWVAFGLFMVIVHFTHPAVGKERYGMVHLRKGDVDVLARTIFGEARGEKRAGMEAVAWVILNRARRGSPRFPGTIAEVCKSPYQFTCWGKNDPNARLCAAVDESNPSYLLALNVATAVLGGMVPDPVGGADHYHVTKMPNPPAWANKMRLVKRIGAHSFFIDD